VKTEPQHTCPSCGNEFSGAMQFCPVCMLHKALGGVVASGESSASEDTLKPTTSEKPTHRLEHYELVTDEDGKPVELGRGAMGVTYKAFDVDLHCPVTLKVVSERYLGDESARLRFLREARAAARLRHSNVASVLHLGSKADTGNCDAGCCWSSCGAQAEAGSPRYQTKQHHGELGGGRRCDRKDHRPWAGQARARRAAN